MLDIVKVRKDTAGVANQIHLNNAGASLPVDKVRETMISYINEEMLYGGYETADKSAAALNETYELAAKLINCSGDEIAFTQNASLSWNLAFYSIPFEKGDLILTSDVEYVSNFINFLKLKKEKQVDIVLIPQDEYGMVDCLKLEQMITNKVKLIAITHIPSNSGLINPAEEIGAIAAKYGILYLLDSCQSVGQLPIDVKKIQCSFLTATGRKYLRGPRGTGFLFVDKNVLPKLNPVYLDSYSASWTSSDEFIINPTAKRFETFERNIAGQLGLGEAIRYALAIGVENGWQRIKELSAYLREGLASIDSIKLQDIGNEKCGMVTFTHNRIEPLVVQKLLHQQGININSPGKQSALLDMEKRNLERVNRASVHYYNTKEELDVLLEKLKKM
ncbi:aminotransferase class V-fold PLP-dependent enzyme [Solitalea lacus]|uniref:aminotransferase class V-fold PLP-dependent enzyme n=1 Tax=Solitalea lacus TaxID=2911172 RepID=UPI001EDAB4B5|nr:aminotransferase class V-fold PLP-dependent enzyme [Solitalea lacus]UKJ08648.1 aminotransferase class V-fold PLP-dependent enzyme [Solitalea lacus]